MKLALKILGGLVAFLMIVIMGGFAYLSTVDVNTYKPDIVAAVKKATGRDLVINSPIDLEISLTPSLTVKDVLLGNPGWAGAEPMMRVADFAIKLDVLALLDSRIVIDRLVLKEGVVNLKRNADGDANWQFDPLNAAAADQGTAQKTTRDAASSEKTTDSDPTEKVIPTIRSGAGGKCDGSFL